MWSSMIARYDWLPMAWRPTWRRALKLAYGHIEACGSCQNDRPHAFLPRDVG